MPKTRGIRIKKKNIAKNQNFIITPPLCHYTKAKLAFQRFLEVSGQESGEGSTAK